MNLGNINRGGHTTCFGATAAVALLLVTSGCADLQLTDEDLHKLADYISMNETLEECGPPPVTPPAAPVTIQIEFKQKSIGGGATVWCPEGVKNDCPLVFKGNDNGIEWESVDSAGTHLNEKFRVFLTPFNGDSFPSGNNGRTGRKKLSVSAPRAAYKYTVLKEGDNADKCKPFDPVFYVN